MECEDLTKFCPNAPTEAELQNRTVEAFPLCGPIDENGICTNEVIEESITLPVKITESEPSELTVDYILYEIQDMFMDSISRFLTETDFIYDYVTNIFV